MTENAYFEPNLAVFGPKILILTGGNKCFGIHLTEKNHLGTLFALFFEGWIKTFGILLSGNQ